jgi:ketosteroid isomerase-like protein
MAFSAPGTSAPHMHGNAPPEVLAIVMENYEWWNGGEPELMLNSYVEDGVLDLSAVFTDMPALHGRESISRHMGEFWEAWGGLKMESLAIHDVGGRRFVVDMRLRGTGRRSGAEVDQRFAWLYTLHPVDDKVVRAQLFPTVKAASDFAALRP